MQLPLPFDAAGSVIRSGFLRGDCRCQYCGAVEACQWPVVLQPSLTGFLCDACGAHGLIPFTIHAYLPPAFDAASARLAAMLAIETLLRPRGDS